MAKGIAKGSTSLANLEQDKKAAPQQDTDLFIVNKFQLITVEGGKKIRLLSFG